MSKVYSIYLFHLLFVGPLLVLIGLYHEHPNFPKILWNLLIILGLGVMLYHGSKAYRLYTSPA